MTEQDNNIAPGTPENDIWRKGKRLLIEVEITNDVHVYQSVIMKSLYSEANIRDSIIGGFTVQKVYARTYRENAELLKGELIQRLDDIIERA